MAITFTAEELAEMAAADAEIDAAPITNEEVAASIRRDRTISLANKDHKSRKLADYQHRYYEANKEKVAGYQRRYYEANKEKFAESKRRYYEANKEKLAESKRRYREAKRSSGSA